MGLLRNYLISNLKLKVISFVIAVVIWVAITTIGEDRQNIYVPIVATGIQSDRVLIRLDPEGVFLTVKGAISELKNLRKNELKVTINLSGFPEGHHTYHIDKKSVSLTKGLKIEDIHPDVVAVELDRIIKKRMRVVIKIDDELLGKYDIKSYYPKFVEVEGPEKILATRFTVETVPFKERLETNEKEVSLDLNVEGMHIRSITPSAVKVKLVRRGRK
ncbi:MAG: CdaR family protein [Deltaproteobacteria bacterium]|nr:CdaR family protein [Deltaproteobacteria bacterium]